MSVFKSIGQFVLTILLTGVIHFVPMSGAAKNDHLTTVILGDIEGKWELLESFLNKTGAFEFIEGQWAIKPGYRFIFLGDAVDKGNASLRILSVLVHFQESFPNQFVGILGNRDINKLRLPKELSSRELRLAPNEDAATQSFQDWLRANLIPNEKTADPVVRLKWILEKTMGAPQAFEFRRQELARLQAAGAVTDHEVMESFLADFEPKQGIMSRYLSKAQLAFVDNANRSLFVHGGLTAEAFGSIPGFSQVDDVREWVKVLNGWAQEQIKDGILNRSGALELVRYQQPIPGTRANQASVVYGRNFDSAANPELIPENLQKALLKQNIDTLVVGHTPVGDMPVVISNGKFRIIFVDNSTAHLLSSPSISLRNGVLKVSAKSPLPGFAEEINYSHTLGKESSIGKHTSSGWVIGSSRGEDLSFRINKEKGFKIEYQITPSASGASSKCFQSFY